MTPIVLGSCITAFALCSQKWVRLGLIWLVVSPFPFALEDSASRFLYFILIPMVFLSAFFFQKTMRIRRIRVIVILMVILVSSLNAGRLRENITLHGREGEFCKSALDRIRASDLSQEDVIYVNYIPRSLMNGFPQMMDLFLERTCEIRPLSIYHAPPFTLFGSPEFYALPLDTPVLNYIPSPSSGSPMETFGAFEIKRKHELLHSKNMLPMFGLRYDYEVVEDQECMKRMARSEFDPGTTVLLDRSPSIRCSGEGSESAEIKNVWIKSEKSISLVVYSPSPCFLIICLPFKLSAVNSRFFVDGEESSPFRAYSRFNALELNAGRHCIDILKFK